MSEHEPAFRTTPIALGKTPPRRLGAFAAAALLLLSAAIAGCDGNASADGNASGNGGRGHVKLGIPF